VPREADAKARGKREGNFSPEGRNHKARGKRQEARGKREKDFIILSN